LQRLEEQLQAKKSSLGAYSSKIEALTQQIQALEKGKILKLEQTQNKLRQANMKVSIDSASLEAIKVDAQIAKSQWERMKVLYEKQLEPLVKLEERQNKFQSSLAKKNEGENKLALSKNEWLNAQLEVTSILADYQDKISKSYSELSSAHNKFN
jgi:Mg2+ and Co2+ transporter CorA